MSIAYSGGTIVNTTFTGTDRPTLAAAIISNLLTAGWTNVSGSGNDQVLKSAATASGVTGLQIAVRVYDPGSANCSRMALRNVSGSRIGQDMWLLPGVGKTYRIIASKYQFFVMTPGASATREFVCGGQLYIPTWLTGVTLNAGWAQGSGTSDSDVTARVSFRTNLNNFANPNNQTTIVADTMLSIVLNNANATHRLSQLQSGYLSDYNQGYRWSDGTLMVSDAFLASGLAGATDEAKVQGQLWDACVICDSFTADATISLDGHTWMAITGGNAGSVGISQAKGTLFVMVA